MGLTLWFERFAGGFSRRDGGVCVRRPVGFHRDRDGVGYLGHPLGGFVRAVED